MIFFSSSFILSFGNALLFKFVEVSIHKSSSLTPFAIVHSNWTPSLIKNRFVVGQSNTLVPFISKPEISTTIFPLYSDWKLIVIVVPFAANNPTFTIPKDDFTELVLTLISSKESPTEIILGLPPNLQRIFPSISSEIEHSIFVPVWASNFNIFPASQVKALLFIIKLIIYKLVVVVSPVLSGINLIIVFFPSTETNSISTFPNFEVFEGTWLTIGVNVSPVDKILGFPNWTQDDEVGVDLSKEHWNSVPEDSSSNCIFDTHVK